MNRKLVNLIWKSLVLIVSNLTRKWMITILLIYIHQTTILYMVSRPLSEGFKNDFLVMPFVGSNIFQIVWLWRIRHILIILVMLRLILEMKPIFTRKLKAINTWSAFGIQLNSCMICWYYSGATISGWDLSFSIFSDTTPLLTA